jgi:ribose transport system substrate-binding protein
MHDRKMQRALPGRRDVRCARLPILASNSLMPHTSHAILLATLVGFSCARHEPAAAAARPRRVAVIPKGTSHEFWKAVESGARRADAELDDLEIVWQGPAGEGATQQQIALVEACAAGDYDALCIAPLDARALVPAVRRALDRKLTVVVFDSSLAASDLGVTTFVASENRHGGEMAGAELARAMNATGNVIVLRYQMGSESTTEREDACLATLAQHQGIHVLSADVYAGPDESAAVAASEKLLSTFDGRVGGVFCPNESSTSGFLTALQRHPRDSHTPIVVVGFDLSTRIVQALDSGLLAATVAQDPVAMGYRSVVAAHDALAHKPVDARIETPEILVRRDMLEQPEVQRLLDPFQSRR